MVASRRSLPRRIVAPLLIPAAAIAAALVPASAARADGSAWPSTAATGKAGAIELAWPHQQRFHLYEAMCSPDEGAGPTGIALLADADNFNLIAEYADYGYDVSQFDAGDGEVLTRDVRGPAAEDLDPVGYTCMVVGIGTLGDAGTYEYSDGASATPSPGPNYVAPPVAPSGLSADASGPATVALAWDAVAATAEAPVDGYRVYVDDTVVAEVPSSDATAYTATGLVSGVEHRFGVAAFGPGGESPVTAAVSTPVPALYVDGLMGPYDGPRGMAFDHDGNFYVSLPDAQTVLKVSPAGVVSALTGAVETPSVVAVDADGNVYVADGFSHVRKVTPDGSASVFATGFDDIRDLAVDSEGNVYVAHGLPDGSAKVSEVTPDGAVSDIAVLDNLMTITVGPADTLYLATADGTITTRSPDGQIGNAATVGSAQPIDMVSDANGNLYLAEANDTVYRISAADGTVTAVAGGFSAGIRGVGYSAGTLYVSDAVGTVSTIPVG